MEATHDTTLGEVRDASENLIRALAAAHVKWLMANQEPDGNGLKARLAVYVALRSMSSAFGIAGLLAEPAYVKILDAMADGIELRMRPLDAELMSPKGNA